MFSYYVVFVVVPKADGVGDVGKVESTNESSIGMEYAQNDHRRPPDVLARIVGQSELGIVSET